MAKSRKPLHEQFAEDMQRGIESLRALSSEERRAWLIEKKYITEDGRLHPRYGGERAPAAKDQQPAG